MPLPRRVLEIEGEQRDVDVVAFAPFGDVVRPVDAQAPSELRLQAVGTLRTAPLRCGPSLLALLERMPDGELPPESVCAVVELIARRPLQPAARIEELRFDVDDGRFHWPTNERAGVAAASFGDDDDGVALAWRLLSDARPTFDKLVIKRARRPNEMRDWFDDVALPFGDAGAVDAGHRQLAGLVASSLRGRLRAAREQREQWWVHDGDAPLRVSGAGNAESMRKAALLFWEALREQWAGRDGAARMNMKLATIYDPEHERYRRALALMER